jgi:hypothetical protein
MGNNNSWIIAVLILAALLVNIFAMNHFAGKQVNASLSANDRELIVKEVAEAIPQPSQVNSSVTITDGPKTTAIYDKLFEDDKKEAEALQLATDEIETKSFKVEIESLVNSELNLSGLSSSIEYKDITAIKIIDSDVNLEDEDAEATLEIKVYYNFDGDEEETGKARLNVILSVTGLSVDDKFVDAEIVDYDSSNFEFVRFY